MTKTLRFNGWPQPQLNHTLTQNTQEKLINEISFSIKKLLPPLTHSAAVAVAPHPPFLISRIMCLALELQLLSHFCSRRHFHVCANLRATSDTLGCLDSVALFLNENIPGSVEVLAFMSIRRRVRHNNFSLISRAPVISMSASLMPFNESEVGESLTYFLN